MDDWLKASRDRDTEAVLNSRETMAKLLEQSRQQTDEMIRQSRRQSHLLVPVLGTLDQES